MNVVRDSDALTVLYLGPGALYQMPDRIAELSPQQRHGPATWAMRAAGDWTLVEQPWQSTHVLTFLYPHKYFAIRMFFAERDWRHLCWYVDFQRPYVRTPIGFEALDLALDIVVPAHDIDARIVKDEEQYLAGIEQGGISSEDAGAIALARSELVDLEEAPFGAVSLGLVRLAPSGRLARASCTDAQWNHWRWRWTCRLTTACSRRPSQSPNLHAQIFRLSGARLMRHVETVEKPRSRYTSASPLWSC